MKTEHLREFSVLARYLNFTEASKELFIAQSTLSSHIAQLEGELGFSLLERKGDVRLTVAGSLFLETVHTVLDDLSAGEKRCRVVAEGSTALRVAFNCPPIVFARRCRAELDFPFVFVTHDYQNPFFSVFTSGSADVLFNYDFRLFPALAREADRLGLTVRSIAPSPASITVSTDHWLAHKKRVVRDDLRGAIVVVNSAPDYERWKAVVTSMLGEDLDLSFELEPVGDLSNLTFAEPGNRLHLCSRELNEQYLARRVDIAVIERVEGADLRIPQVAAWRSDADHPTRGRIEALCACWNACMTEKA